LIQLGKEQSIRAIQPPTIQLLFFGHEQLIREQGMRRHHNHHIKLVPKLELERDEKKPAILFTRF